MLTVLHGSDLQYGKPYRPAVGAAFSTLAHELAPDLIVIAGDLTQRAKASEFRGVRAFLATLPDGVPVVLTPGNHDVPLFRVWERAMRPYKNWRRFISEELDTVTRIDGATVVALNSSAPHRAIVSGHLSDEQVAWAEERFHESPDDDLRLLVVHHHFIATEDRLGGDPLDDGPRLLAEFERMGVDAVMGGHVHQTHLISTRTILDGAEGDPGVALIACGTTASSRGRGPEEGRNTLNVVRFLDDEIEVVPHEFVEDHGGFRALEKRIFERRVSRAPRDGGS